VALLLVSACYAPAYTNCFLTCATSGTCPDGYECDGMFCRSTSSTQTCVEIRGDAMLTSDATVDGAPGVDTDRDNVYDDVDNCLEVPNTKQYDEDGDGKGNPCDPCPIGPTANDDADTDLDSVGDGCDPDPEVPGHSLVLFDGLDEMPTDPDVVGTWTFGGGKATGVGSATASTVLRWDGQLSPGTDRFSIRTKVTLDAFGTTNLPQIAGTLDTLGMGGDGRGCGLGIDSNAQNGLHGVMVSASVSIIMSASTTPPTGPTTTHALFHERFGSATNIRCATSPNFDITPTFSSTVSTETGMGLVVRNATASFDFILVIRTP